MSTIEEALGRRTKKRHCMSWRCSLAGRMLTQHETLDPSPVLPKQGEGVYIFEPRSGEVEAEKNLDLKVFLGCIANLRPA